MATLPVTWGVRFLPMSERLILAGKVRVNGAPLRHPSQNLVLEDIPKGALTIDGIPFDPSATHHILPKIWGVYKLPGELVATKDSSELTASGQLLDKGRPLIYARLAAMGLPKHVMPVVSPAMRRNWHCSTLTCPPPLPGTPRL